MFSSHFYLSLPKGSFQEDLRPKFYMKFYHVLSPEKLFYIHIKVGVYVVHVGDISCAYRPLVGNPEAKKPLERPTRR
jgi:hypothetical protein